MIKESVIKGTKTKFTEKLVHRYFDEIVDKIPDQIAIIDEG